MKRLIIFFMAVLILFVGCGQAEAEPEIVSNESYPTYEEFISQETVKTVLIWYSNDSLEKSLLNSVNEHLDSLGKDYAVYFERIQYDKGSYYIDNVKKRIADGYAVDILSTGSYFPEDEGFSNPYHHYISEDIFLPIDEYLSDTAVGKKLYNQMPSGYWKSLSVNGKIYGVSVQGMLTETYGYYANKKLAEKYGWDINKPIVSQLDILKKIKEKGIVPCYIDYSPGSPAYQPNPFMNTFGVYYDASNDSVKRITKDEEWLDRIRTINTLAREEFLIENASNKEPFLSLCAIFPFTGEEYGCTIETIGFIEISPSILCLDEPGLSTPIMATGVSKSSQYPDLAFDLLATVQSDAYLNNMLSFKGAQPDSNGNMPVESTGFEFYHTFGNRMISYQSEAEAKDYPEKFYNILSGENTPAYWGFAFDSAPVKDVYQRVIKVMNSFDFCQNTDFDSLIADLNSKLDEAGIDELVNEINNQYDDYKLRQNMSE